MHHMGPGLTQNATGGVFFAKCVGLDDSPQSERYVPARDLWIHIELVLIFTRWRMKWRLKWRRYEQIKPGVTYAD